MSEIITTLHEKGTPTNEVYPNIKSDNIPSGAVTSLKLSDNAVTTSKIVNNAVTTEKINDGAIITSKIANGSINFDKLEQSLSNILTAITNFYDTENDEIEVTSIEAYDNMKCDKLEATSRVITDELSASSININGEEIKPIYNHCIKTHLLVRENHSENSYFIFHFTSTNAEAITNINDLVSELSKKMYMSVWDYGTDTAGVISNVVNDSENTYVSIYCGNPISEEDFDEILDITDDVTPL